MTPDPSIIRRIEAHEWRYSQEDPAALEALRFRIDQCGRRGALISYSDLVSGVEFRLPSLWPQPHSIDVHAWSGLERKVIGDFLGCITTDSYRQHDFMASALVVGKHEDHPSDHFFEWMEFLHVLPNLHPDTVLRFWVEQVRAAHRHYLPPR